MRQTITAHLRPLLARGPRRSVSAGASFLLFLLALTGCAQQGRARSQSTASRAATMRFEPCTFSGQKGTRVVTARYLIYTTIGDAEFLARVARVMEGASDQYRAFTPALQTSAEPFSCYLFLTRDQWADFTRKTTGADATIYLHINRGGYAVRDCYVAYYMGDLATFSVAAHEGFHQYVARNFKNRVAPFLEEGIACMFEDIRWDGDTPYWNLEVNGERLSSLRTAVDRKRLFPLSQLCITHAGQVVNGPPVRIAAFYGQSWAFARFLWEGNHGKYRAGLQAMLTDAARGALYAASDDRIDAPGGWDPRSARLQLEHYLGHDLATLDREFQRYISAIVDRSVEWEATSPTS